MRKGDQQVSSGQLENLNFLKGISILFVCFYHTIPIELTEATLINDWDKVLYFIQTIFSTGVPLFFMINGYLMLRKKRGLKQHTKKTITIIVLAVSWAVIMMLFYMLVNQHLLSIKEFVSGVIHLKKGWLNHLWFLEALVLCYIVFPLIQYLYFGRKKWFYILFIVLWIGTIGRTLLVYGLNYFHGMGNDSLWLLCQLSRQRGVYFIYTLSYFCLGGILHRYSIRGENRKVRILCFLVLVIAMFIQYIYGVDRITSKGQGYDIVWEGYNTVPTFLMVLALYEMTITITGNNIISRWICYIGRNTLGIYFLHRCFIILGNLLVGEEIGQLFVVQIGLAIASIVLSLFIVFLMNKNVWTKQLISLQS